jgi:hypothetical protein
MKPVNGSASEYGRMNRFYLSMPRILTDQSPVLLVRNPKISDAISARLYAD